MSRPVSPLLKGLISWISPKRGTCFCADQALKTRRFVGASRGGGFPPLLAAPRLQVAAASYPHPLAPPSDHGGYSLVTRQAGLTPKCAGFGSSCRMLLAPRPPLWEFHTLGLQPRVTEAGLIVESRVRAAAPDWPAAVRQAVYLPVGLPKSVLCEGASGLRLAGRVWPWLDVCAW